MNKGLFHLKTVVALAVSVLSLAARAETFSLTITNGTSMPISPAAVYTINGQDAVDQFGQAPSQGLVTLCQTGNPSVKLNELASDGRVTSIAKTSNLVFPGQSATVTINVPLIRTQSLHFIAMYGKSKDLCSSINVSSAQLMQINSNPGFTLTGGDAVIEAGAAAQPVVSSDPNACANAANAISCLRTLAPALSTGAQIHAFAGYLPSLLNFLETKYGPDDVLTLTLPSSGGVSFRLSR